MTLMYLHIFQYQNGSQISIDTFESNALVNQCVKYISEKVKDGRKLIKTKMYCKSFYLYA